MKAKEVVLQALKTHGLSKNDSDDKFDPKELKRGTEIELEHFNDKKIAKEIAKDHLREDPKYYSKKFKKNEH